MKRGKTYLYRNNWLPLIGLLLPLMIFLLLSCPVKRALLSSFEGEIEIPGQQTETVDGVSATVSLHCGFTYAQDFQSATNHSFFKHPRWGGGNLDYLASPHKRISKRFNVSVAPGLPVETDPQVTLFLRKQSFLI